MAGKPITQCFFNLSSDVGFPRLIGTTRVHTSMVNGMLDLIPPLVSLTSFKVSINLTHVKDTRFRIIKFQAVKQNLNKHPKSSFEWSGHQFRARVY